MKATVLIALVAGVGVCTGVTMAADGPMVDAGLDQTVSVDTTVQLDGSGSTHPDGSIETYEWRIEGPDGSHVDPTCADCERTSFEATQTGRYVVTLEATGGDGSTATDELFVNVEDAGPEVELDGPVSPEPNEPVKYTADAESPDATLETVSWAVEDQLVGLYSLDGRSADPGTMLAFTETSTHRVQVVVQDSNGRTAYDQMHVRPRTDSGGVGVSSRTGCDDASYRSSNPDECGSDSGDEPATETPGTPDSPPVEHAEIRFESDGYEAHPTDTAERTSNYIGFEGTELGLDGGENAPWESTGVGQSVANGLDRVGTMFLGQEKETVTCSIEGGQYDACRDSAVQLEQSGGTQNVHSPDSSGAYQSYGIADAERVQGPAPDQLEDGQSAEVTVVTQEEKDGYLDVVRRSADRFGDRVGDRVSDTLPRSQSDSPGGRSSSGGYSGSSSGSNSGSSSSGSTGGIDSSFTGTTSRDAHLVR